MPPLFHLLECTLLLCAFGAVAGHLLGARRLAAACARGGLVLLAVALVGPALLRGLVDRVGGVRLDLGPGAGAALGAALLGHLALAIWLLRRRTGRASPDRRDLDASRRGRPRLPDLGERT